MAGVPLRPRILPPHTARGILPTGIPERTESPYKLPGLLEFRCRARAMADLYVYHLPPTLRLRLVEHAVATCRRHAVSFGSDSNYCRSSVGIVYLS